MLGLFNTAIKEPKLNVKPLRPDGDFNRNRWLMLIDAIERLAASQGVTETVAVVKDTARVIANSDGVTFVMRDGEFCHYVEENAIGPLWKGKRFPMTACISGWAMLNKQSAIIEDIYADKRIPHDAYKPTFVKSLLMVPVRREDPVAAIGIYWAQQIIPDADTVILLEALARSTAIAMENAYLQARLAESGDRMHMALDAAELGAWEMDIVTESFYVSPRCKAHFGLAADAEFTFETMLTHVHPEDRATLTKQFQHAKRGGTLQMEFRVRWPVNPMAPDKNTDTKPEYHWLEFRGGALQDIVQPPRRISGVSIHDHREKPRH